MGFFARGDQSDEEQAEALARIEAGGIPARAEERLKGLRDGSLFTSGLSVNEFALLDRLGPQPLAQVMGASVVRPGWQYLPALDPAPVVLPKIGGWYSTGPSASGYSLNAGITEPSLAQVRGYKWHATVVCRLDMLTDAWNLARRRALDRLTEEAVHVGADAVVGVRLRRGEHDLGGGTIEYVVTGTAIRLPGSAGTSWPILTDVSVQDYWRLRSAGHQPAGLLATTVVVFASPPRDTQLRRARQAARNQELEELSRGFQMARETIRSRLLSQVSDAHAEGAVGVEIVHDVHKDKLPLASSLTGSGQQGWRRGRLGIPYRVSGHSDVERRGWVITMHAAGTAIRSGPRLAATPVKTTMRMRSI